MSEEVSEEVETVIHTYLGNGEPLTIKVYKPTAYRMDPDAVVTIPVYEGGEEMNE